MREDEHWTDWIIVGVLVGVCVLIVWSGVTIVASIVKIIMGWLK